MSVSADSPGELPRTTALIEHGMAQGLHIGAQLYISRHGQVLADRAFGESSPGVAMTPDTIMLWLSSGKPVTAVAVAQLWERGRLDLDDRVAEHIPEFGVKGKEPITIRHVLTHTGGFRAAAQSWSDQSWERIIATICDSRIELNWIPGRTAGYHVAAGWFILGEIVRRLDPKQRSFDQYVREEIFLPLGMNDTWIGMPIEQQRAYGSRIGLMHRVKSSGQISSDFPGNTESARAIPRPGSNAHGPIRELGRFYEMILNRGRLPSSQSQIANHESQILTSQSIEALTARHRVGTYDQTFKHLLDWSLGFIPNNHYHGETAPYNYGPHASPRAVGHSGQQSSTAFADPEHGLAVAVVFNGMPGERQHNQRQRALCTAIYEDLGWKQSAGSG